MEKPVSSAHESSYGPSGEKIWTLDIRELEALERKLIPLLNIVREIQGKRPVIVPNDKRAHD